MRFAISSSGTSSTCVAIHHRFPVESRTPRAIAVELVLGLPHRGPARRQSLLVCRIAVLDVEMDHRGHCRVLVPGAADHHDRVADHDLRVADGAVGLVHAELLLSLERLLHELEHVRRALDDEVRGDGAVSLRNRLHSHAIAPFA